jgi:hypothetical protein
MIGDAFGTSVAYLNGVILVGAPYASVGATAGQGKAYIFKEINGSWQEEAILTSSASEERLHFGISVALVPDFGIVGAPLADLYGRVDNGQLLFFRHY